MKNIYELFYDSYQKKKRVCAKLYHYLEIYDILFKNIRNNEIVFLEIGVKLGGSIDLWNLYFPNLKKYIGIDIDNKCEKFKDSNTDIYIGDQCDKLFLNSLTESIKDKIDIVLDDGGHQFHQQINSFNVLFKKLEYGGTYIIEDTHSSYDNYSNIYPEDNVYGGGKNKISTTIEFFKSLSDEVTAWSYIKEHGTCPLYKPRNETWIEFLKQNNIEYKDIDYFRENIFSITFFDSIIVIKKKIKSMPYIIFNDKNGKKYTFHDKSY